MIETFRRMMLHVQVPHLLFFWITNRVTVRVLVMSYGAFSFKFTYLLYVLFIFVFVTLCFIV